jgi:GNAT superfamily N-acetyltransferase
MCFVPDVYFKVTIVNKADDIIAEGSLRSPVNVHEIVDTYPAPYVLLDEIYTAPKHRRQGLSTRVIKLLLDEASSHDWAVLCRPSGFGRGKMARDALFAFYRRLGWRDDPHQQLTEHWLVKPAPLRLVHSATIHSTGQ